MKMTNRRPTVSVQTVQHGFTLLEVLVALTITAMVLGGLFTLAAGSKQLAGRAQSSLSDTVQARANINFALLDNQFRDIESVIEDEFDVSPVDELEDPLRRTAPMYDLLETYRMVDPETGEQIEGVRWLRSDLPR